MEASVAFSPRMPSPWPLQVAFLSTFVPRECGLATFTEDVMRAVDAHGVRCQVAAMERPGRGLYYDHRVFTTIREDTRSEYLAAAEAVNRREFDVLSVQHEFGIYGGEECEHLLDLMEAVEAPVVTTLHTVLSRPSAAMRRNLHRVAARSDALVVMNALGIDILAEVYDVDPSKIHVIHHGAPVVSKARKYTIKQDLGIQGSQVISTFGLLSAGKGLEYAVEAMPYIVARHPDVLYYILGQTHPVIKQEEGERYRESLQARARALGVDDHVRFVDKYFTKAELLAYLMATDIYLTPYLNLEQVTSGTLAYAMACGRPLVSTPYLYARFLLENDRGILVPPRDPRAMADACLRILDNPRLKARMEQANWDYGRAMVWSRVGAQYQQLFHSLAALRGPVVVSAPVPVRR
ncbi:MAG: D-inositol 3-phosphate glycosyltransferase [bacterium ADurb.Bin429]|nr:MAG: D-inositol 3-phosphate glycosyltransferase [bacterium ADurb.Bin429]